MKQYSKAPQKLPVAVDLEEIDAILYKTQKIHHKLAFIVAFCFGLRISEVVNLQPIDFDFKNRSIRVNQGKGSKDRIVPMPKGFREDLLVHFPIKCKQRALQKAFVFYAEKSGVADKKPTVHFHSLRHGFATHCLRMEIALEMIRRMMGHTDISTTAIYLNLYPKEVLDAYEEKF